MSVKTNKKTNRNLRTWVEIDRQAIKSNIGTLKKLLLPGCKLMAVVKSNAYGHGLIPFAGEMIKLSADWLGVDDLDEALAVRKLNKKIPILVFGHVLPARLREAARAGVSVTISNFELLRAAAQTRGLKVHIKVDTGLGRQGFLSRDRKQVIAQAKNFRIEGLYTHFAASEDPRRAAYTRRQISEFKKWTSAFARAGFNPIQHVSCTASALYLPEFNLDMVRVGIGLYGLWPSEEIRKLGKKINISLRPVLTWKTVVGEIKTLPKGSGVGYDLTVHLKRKTKVAVLPVGYWHGYPRHLSGKGEVVVHGIKAKVLGRISMDMIVIDVTDIPNVKAGDKVFLIGGSRRAYVDADDLARKAGTINYEIVTRINQNIPRMYN